MFKASEFWGLLPDTPNQRTWTFDLDGQPFTLTQWEVWAILTLREAAELDAELVLASTAGE